MVNTRKVAIIGCGMVGSSIAFALMERGIFHEMVLIDATPGKALGEAMDLSHGLPYSGHMIIKAGEYKDISDAGLVIITAGAAQKPGETRLDLIKKNKAIMASIIGEINKVGIEGIILIVSNPVDILTHVALKLSGLPKNRVFGSGTVLDTARLKYLLSRELDVDTRNIHAVIIGEHGDSEVAVWSFANVSGVPIDDFASMRGIENHYEAKQRIYEDVRDSAYEIIKLKGATYYGIAMAVMKIARCVVKNEHTMLPISVELEGEYGLSGLSLSVPAILGENGVEVVLEVPLNLREKRALEASAAQMKEVISGLDLTPLAKE